MEPFVGNGTEVKIPSEIKPPLTDMKIGLLMCFLISGLRNQGLFQTLEKIQALKSQIFFRVEMWKNLRYHPHNRFALREFDIKK